MVAVASAATSDDENFGEQCYGALAFFDVGASDLVFQTPRAVSPLLEAPDAPVKGEKPEGYENEQQD